MDILKFQGQQLVKTKFQKEQLTKKVKFDAGLDIKSKHDCIVPAGESRLIKTDLYIAIPNNFVGLIWSRSGLSVKHGIEVGAGCIDSNYRGEVKVLLYNHSNTNFDIKRGDRIAQLLTIPVCLNNYKQVDKLDDTIRGENGFGSSGI